MPTRRGKTIVSIMEKEITVMEAYTKKKERKKLDWKNIRSKGIVKATIGHVQCVIYRVNSRHIYLVKTTIDHFECVFVNLCY
jgi:uncharacterized protein YfbU (UPF0304 family)